MVSRIQSRPVPSHISQRLAPPTEPKQRFELRPAASQPAEPRSAAATARAEPLRRLAESIERQRAELDRAIQAAARGRAFSPAELVVLQARVFSYGENLEVLSQILDKSVGAMKTALNTQL